MNRFNFFFVFSLINQYCRNNLYQDFGVFLPSRNDNIYSIYDFFKWAWSKYIKINVFQFSNTRSHVLTIQRISEHWINSIGRCSSFFSFITVFSLLNSSQLCFFALLLSLKHELLIKTSSSDFSKRQQKVIWRFMWQMITSNSLYSLRKKSYANNIFHFALLWSGSI